MPDDVQCMENGPKPSPVQFDIAWRTIIKVLLGVLLAYVAIKLWPLAQLLIVSALLAVPLYRLVLWGCRKHWPRWAGILAATLALVFAVLGVAALAAPALINQGSQLATNFPKMKQQILSHVPNAALKKAVEGATDFGSSSNLQHLWQQAFSAAKSTAGGLLDLVLVIALCIYLMVDGPRALQWLIAFFPAEQRDRVSKGLDKIGDRMVAYIVGQAIISCFFAVYVGVVLSILHVPMALLLAVIAGLLDVVPVLGIFISLVLGALLGLTVSPTTALLVVVLYTAYHVFEDYFLLPKIYGQQLRLSTLAVLLSMVAGGMVAGIIGAVAVLPVVAAYPALEVLWLSPRLEPEVVRDHQKQLRAA
jgi:predicted PurR-regulated permease PerM